MKLRNKFVLILLAICLFACLGVAVACGNGDGSDPNECSVTVKIGNIAVDNVKVVLTKGGLSLPAKTTDENGRAVFSLADCNGYTVELDELPDGYEVADGAVLAFSGDRHITVQLTEKFAYKIKLVNPDGSAFTDANTSVGICTVEGVCLQPVSIGADGVGKIYDEEKTNYHVQVLNLPAGKAYESDEHRYAIYKDKNGNYITQGENNTYVTLTETEHNATITVYDVNEIALTDGNKLTSAQIEQYRTHGMDIQGSDAYKTDIEVAGETTVYLRYKAEHTGIHHLYTTNTDLVYKQNPVFLLGDVSWSGSGVMSGSISLTKGDVIYFNVTNTASAQATAQLIMATPAASVATASGAGTVNVTLYKSDSTAVIELTPTVGAKFKASVQGDVTAAIADSNKYVDVNGVYAGFDEQSFKKNSFCEFKFTEDRMGTGKAYSTVYLAVCAKADSYPVTVSVKIEKLADVKNTTNVVTTKQTLTKYDDPQSKELVFVPLDGKTAVVKGDDGYYHYGEDGPIVLVNLKGDLDVGRFSAGGKFVYIEMTTEGSVEPYVVDVTAPADKASLDKGNTYNDYRMVLRGFEQYKYSEKNEASVPNDILIDNYYVNFVNSDGVYPLNDELKDILQKVTGNLAQTNKAMLPQAADGCEWLFPCCYYDDAVEADAIVGEYKFVSHVDKDGKTVSVGDKKIIDWDEANKEYVYGDVTDAEYKLVVEKRHSFAIYQIENNEEYVEYEQTNIGTWDKDGGVYTFTEPDVAWESGSSVRNDLVYSVVFDKDAGTIKLTAANGVQWVFAK